MKTCESCNRPLEESEERFCPACQASKAFKKNKWIEGVVGALLIVGGIIWGIVTGGKGGRKT
jgi:hypothetical protein